VDAAIQQLERKDRSAQSLDLYRNQHHV